MHKQQESTLNVGAMSKSMLIVMVFTMVSKVTGFLREAVFGSRFSATSISDAYKVAQDVPCFFLSIVITALCATMIPIYAERQRNGQVQANRFINNLFTVGMALSVVMLIGTALLAKPLIDNFLLAKQSQETKDLALSLTWIMMPMGIFVFLARVSSAYLQANFSFTVPALSQVLLNVTIFAAILIPDKVDVTFVAIATVLGWALQYAVQIPSMRRLGHTYKPTFSLADSGLREVAILMVPILVSGLFDQLYLSFGRFMVSGVDGDISMLDYANKLSTMVSAVLLTTIATVLYPSLIRHAGDRQKTRDNLSFGININLLIALPATAVLILLSRPVTQLAFQRGDFGVTQTLGTSSILACYAAGMFGIGLRELCNRCFYAIKDTRTPTLVGIAVVLLNVGLSVVLYPLFGVSGIAVAASASALLSGVALLLWLNHRQKALDAKRVGRCLFKTGAATLAMSVALFGLSTMLKLSDLTGMRLIISFLATFAVGALVYALVLWLLKTEELTMLVGLVKGKLKRNKPGVSA